MVAEKFARQNIQLNFLLSTMLGNKSVKITTTQLPDDPDKQAFYAANQFCYDYKCYDYLDRNGSQ